MKIILNLILCVLAMPYVALASTPNQPDHYCDDKASWQQWEQLLANNPSDDAIMSLYAFRIGLCSMVKSSQIETVKATQLFERMRDTVLKGIDDNNKKKRQDFGT